MESGKKERARDMASRDAPDEKIFFIVKSWILGCFGSLVFLLVVYLLGSINFWQAIYMSMLLFFIPLIIGRYFEKEIDRVALEVTNGLNRRRRIKRIIVKYM